MEQQKYLRKKSVRLLALVISLIVSCDYFSQNIKYDSLVNELVFDYLYSRNYNRLNSTLEEINKNDILKRRILIGLSDFLLNNDNFKCENLIQRKNNVLIHDSILKTELLDLSKNWRLKKELIIMLINEVYSGLIRKNENLSLCIDDKCFSITKSNRESKRQRENCKYFIIEKEENIKILRLALNSVKKWSKELRNTDSAIIKQLESPLKYCRVIVR